MTQQRYMVYVENRKIVPVVVEAECPAEAVERALRGEGEPGQAWYDDTPPPRVKPLGEADDGD